MNAYPQKPHPFQRGLLALALVMVFLCFSYFVISEFSDRQEKRALSKELGIPIRNYFDVSRYYADTLKPGMPIEEVHRLVRGYKLVQKCSYSSELYYYYSTDRSDAERFEIYYDEDYRFDDLETEDQNSKTLGAGGVCIEGRLR